MQVFGNTLLFRQGLVSTSTPVNGLPSSNSNMTGDSNTSSSGFGTAAPASSRTTSSRVFGILIYGLLQ